MIDLNKYLSIPYQDGGRTLSGLDCWGLLLLVRDELGKLPLPTLGDVTRANPLAMGREYAGISSTLEECRPEAGAIAAVFRGRAFVHVGVVVQADDRLSVLETNPGRVPCIRPVGDFLATYYKVIFYRDRNLSE